MKTKIFRDDLKKRLITDCKKEILDFYKSSESKYWDTKFKEIENFHVVLKPSRWGLNELTEGFYLIELDTGCVYRAVYNDGSFSSLEKVEELWDSYLILENDAVANGFERIVYFNDLTFAIFCTNSNFVQINSCEGIYKGSIPVTSVVGSKNLALRDDCSNIRQYKMSMRELAAMGVNLFPNGTSIENVCAHVYGKDLLVFVDEMDIAKIIVDLHKD